MSYEEVGEILKLIEQLDYDEVTLEFGDVKIHVARGVAAQAGDGSEASAPPGAGEPAQAQSTSTHEAPAQDDEGQPRDEDADASVTDDGDVEGAVAIKAPMVGTFYRAPSPDEDPFVEEGAEVTAGQQVGIIEVMKLMNTVDAEVDGVVKRIDADNAKPVEYGQPLMWIEPTT